MIENILLILVFCAVGLLWAAAMNSIKAYQHRSEKGPLRDTFFFFDLLFSNNFDEIGRSFRRKSSIQFFFGFVLLIFSVVAIIVVSSDTAV